jgi:O-antigen biosynthesis protein
VNEHPDIESSPESVSVLIPVYRDLGATRRCLESVLDSKLPPTASVTVINDSSPEPELSAYCRKLAITAGWRLIENTENLGFVKTANHGFALYPQADILLLNSDTIVSSDWLQRLRACAYKNKEIGTVTPFSNNATICSYPVFPIANPLPNNWTFAELDDVFRSANDGAYYEIPTAVGFCMYIKRSCLDQTGPFDESNFGHGYGEECDFSMRANAFGWKHVVAADVFVYHEGAASFGIESIERKRRADKIMSDIHPEYHSRVHQFLVSDPLANFRRNADAARLTLKPERNKDILEEHLHYARLLRAQLADSHKQLVAERVQIESLSTLLDECRTQFRTTDQALEHAHEVIDELTERLHSSRIYAEQLKEHIKNMEDSRSWRYTAWLRGK